MSIVPRGVKMWTCVHLPVRTITQNESNFSQTQLSQVTIWHQNPRCPCTQWTEQMWCPAEILPSKVQTLISHSMCPVESILWLMIVVKYLLLPERMHRSHHVHLLPYSQILPYPLPYSRLLPLCMVHNLYAPTTSVGCCVFSAVCIITIRKNCFPPWRLIRKLYSYLSGERWDLRLGVVL